MPVSRFPCKGNGEKRTDIIPGSQFPDPRESQSLEKERPGMEQRPPPSRREPTIHRQVILPGALCPDARVQCLTQPNPGPATARSGNNQSETRTYTMADGMQHPTQDCWPIGSPAATQTYTPTWTHICHAKGLERPMSAKLLNRSSDS